MKKSQFDSSMVDSLASIYSQQAVSATYTPNGGTEKTVSLLVDDRTANAQDKSGGRVKVTRLAGSVRVSEVASLQRGDTFQLDGETEVFKVLPSSVMNDGLEWDFEAHHEIAVTFGDVARRPDR